MKKTIELKGKEYTKEELNNFDYEGWELIKGDGCGEIFLYRYDNFYGTVANECAEYNFNTLERNIAKWMYDLMVMHDKLESDSQDYSSYIDTKLYKTMSIKNIAYMLVYKWLDDNNKINELRNKINELRKEDVCKK